MKFELIVRRYSSIMTPPLEKWQKEVCPDLHQEVGPVRWTTRGGEVTEDEGVVFSFNADTIKQGFFLLTLIDMRVEHLRNNSAFPETEVRINGRLLKYFSEIMAVEMDTTIRDAIALLKKSRGRKPSKKESDVRRMLEKALPENQRWLTNH